MSTDVTAQYSSSLFQDPPDTVATMDTSATDVEPKNIDEPANQNHDEPSTETKTGKRKRSAKNPVENNETTISSGRPRRTLPKREESMITMVNGGTAKANRTKAQRNSAEQAVQDADDEQEREKNIPIVYDVADIVWVKIGGHPWWPSLVIRDPNDTTRCFTKISGSTRAKRMYFVVFYGSTADFAWVSDAAIIPYQGVEAFTKYAQEIVDKAQTKSQKEQLTERYQLKVTIGRREDWELAVREADEALKQTSETRLEEITPKIQFFTKKNDTLKGQTSRKSKSSMNKTEVSNTTTSSIDSSNRSLLAEKTFEFKSDDDSSDEKISVRKSPTFKIKLKKQTSDEPDSLTTPPAKRRYVRQSKISNENITNRVGPTASYQSGSPTTTSETPSINGSSSGKKRGRPRLNKPSIITTNGDIDATKPTSASSSSTPPKRAITKPQAFVNAPHPVSSLNNILVGQHHRFDTRVGFLSPFEEQEIFDAINQLRSTKTFEEAEQIAKQRFQHILCVNLNKTQVDIPPEWFYSFLFAHPILIVKNTQWFNEKIDSDSLIDNALLNNINRTPSSSSLEVLKHQLSILSKLYHNELQMRQSSVSISTPNSLDKEIN